MKVNVYCRRAAGMSQRMQGSQGSRRICRTRPEGQRQPESEISKDTKHIYKEDKQQEWLYLMTELKAAMASPEKAAAFRKRLRKGMEWDKENKTWKLKEEK